jgi:predicted dehydrogenase
MESDRRQFLKHSFGVTAALTATPVFVPQKARGANDRLNYAVIATGGRGRYLNRVFQKLGAQCVALCDVYEPHLEMALKESPDAKTYVEYRELLEQEKGIDFVILAGPDHHHCPMMLESLSAGKDIYTEKPLSRTLEESLKMIDAVRKSKQVVQIGMQRRSAPVIRSAKRLVDDGVLGKVSMVKPMWNWNIARPLNNSPLPGKLDWGRFLGDAPKRELEPMRFRKWRYFWDYAGGNMTDQGTHLLDVVQWFTNSGPPRSAISYGQVNKMAGSEHPEVFCAVLEYPTFMVTWTLDYCNSYQDGWSITFQGDKGTLVMDKEGYRIYQEPWRDPSNREPIYFAKVRVPVEAHAQNLLDCIKTRQEPNCPVEVGANAVAGPHLANIAFMKGRQAKLSDDGKVSL